MVNINHSRRKILQTFGAGLVGATGMASAKSGTSGMAAAVESDSVEVEASSTPQWTVENPVEGDNVVDVALCVGYYGSQLQSRWVNGSLQDRWVHFLEATFTGTSDSGSTTSYNIDKQLFDTRFYNGTEHNGSPTAGSAAWPNPPFGNWSQVVDAVVEGSLGAPSTIASIALSVDDIKDAYEDNPFDTEQSDKIQFEADYSGWTRENASHSVNFTADQVPGTDGMVDILSAAGDLGAEYNTSSWVYLYPEDDVMYQTPPGSRSVDLQESFDTMSNQQLAENGVQRVNPSKLSKQTKRASRFDLRDNGPTYVKSFNMDVEFGAENGTAVNPSVTKKQ